MIKFGDKKRLAEFMGNYVEGIFIRNRSGSLKCQIEYYNPDTDVLQFIELWDRLSEIQKDDLVLELNWPETDNDRSTFAQGFEFAINMLKKENLPKSIDALLEVISVSVGEGVK